MRFKHYPVLYFSLSRFLRSNWTCFGNWILFNVKRRKFMTIGTPRCQLWFSSRNIVEFIGLRGVQTPVFAFPTCSLWITYYFQVDVLNLCSLLLRLTFVNALDINFIVWFKITGLLIRVQTVAKLYKFQVSAASRLI